MIERSLIPCDVVIGICNGEGCEARRYDKEYHQADCDFLVFDGEE